MKQKMYIASALLGVSMFLMSCDKTSEISDLEKTAAIKNVTVSYNSSTYEVKLPEGAIGHTLKDLCKTAADSAKYLNLENYSITFISSLKADNTSKDAEDAKFEKTALNIVMDTIKTTPIKATTAGFNVNKNDSATVKITSTLNLKTHKRAGYYIFKQTVAGLDLATTFTPVLSYNIGTYQGDFTAPSFQQYIPTRASDETKAFLASLINSNLFNDIRPSVTKTK